MIQVEAIDTTSKEQVHRFVRVPFLLYKGHPQWYLPD
jgi:hypothetical protein